MARELHYATGYANRLLADLGDSHSLALRTEPHPALRWAQCGAMELTGYPEERAQVCPVPLASYADGILAALAALAPASRVGAVDGARLLTERAALGGFRRAGNISAGGSCRLLKAADGWLAVNLPRASDWQLLPAWLESRSVPGWTELDSAVGTCGAAELIERGRLLGLPVAPLRPPPRGAAAWLREIKRTHDAHAAPARVPRVVDLSSLWAGPLCTHLLQLMGAQVIKVESLSRPDGLRRDRSGLFDLLNAGKSSVALDFSRADARAQLRALLSSADIVVEASRPRALRQLGVEAEEVLAGNPRLTWVAISGYGREEPSANWVAFGDDAGVAGGLSQVLLECTRQVMFCADAIADPLTGLHAALAAWSSHTQGGGRLLSVSMCDVVAHGIAFATPLESEGYGARALEWRQQLHGRRVAAPSARVGAGEARAFGADTGEILSALNP